MSPGPLGWAESLVLPPVGIRSHQCVAASAVTRLFPAVPHHSTLVLVAAIEVPYDTQEWRPPRPSVTGSCVTMGTLLPLSEPPSPSYEVNLPSLPCLPPGAIWTPEKGVNVPCAAQCQAG